MSTLKNLRKSLGLTQRELADMLAISRTQLSMAELGLRSLSSSALLKLGNLEAQMTATTSARISIELQRQIQITRKFLVAQIQEYNRLAAVTNVKLEKMRDLHQQYLKGLQGITNLLSAIADNEASREQRLWLEVAEAGLLKKMVACDIAAQMRLQLKIEGFLAQVRYGESKMI